MLLPACVEEAYELSDEHSDTVVAERLPDANLDQHAELGRDTSQARMLSELSGAQTLAPKAGFDFRNLEVNESIDDDTPFEFCRDVAAIDLNNQSSTGISSNAGLSVENARWLAYLAANEYAHPGHFAADLEQLGFGDKGDGVRWLEHSYVEVMDFIDGYSLEKTGDFKSRLATSQNVKHRTVYTKDQMQFFSVGSTQVAWAEHADRNMAVLVFRGTEPTKIGDLITDLTFEPMTVPGWGKAHRGFVEGWTGKHNDASGQYNVSIKDLVMAKLATVADREGFRIWITGHSLGGALAMVAATSIIDSIEHGTINDEGDLEFPKYSLGGVYTYGQPRVGKEDFVTTFKNAASGVFDQAGTLTPFARAAAFPYLRFRFANDVVARSPAIVGDLANHVGQSFHFEPGATDITNRGQDDLARTATGGLTALDDHDMAKSYYPRLAVVSNLNSTTAPKCPSEL